MARAGIGHRFRDGERMDAAATLNPKILKPGFNRRLAATAEPQTIADCSRNSGVSSTPESRKASRAATTENCAKRSSWASLPPWKCFSGSKPWTWAPCEF